MNDPEQKPEQANGADYSATLFLPKTNFPMRAGLPQKEPTILARWREIDLYGRRRAASGANAFVLHDGPPYANGNIHIGHALNKILKDVVTRSQQMSGKTSNYVPGWDCHGLPIEWKIEEEYRAKGRKKPDFSDPAAIVAFRHECRAFAQRWLDVQREEFKRLGVIGDWDHPYTTMSFAAEATIARELMKFADNGLLYRGSKPVMWSVVEKTALAEAEVEYDDYTSDTAFVAFPLFVPTLEPGTASAIETSASPERLLVEDLSGANVVIWTTTPWTLPANRAIAFSSKISYGLYRVAQAPDGNWAKVGARYVLADKLADGVFKAAKVEAYDRVRSIDQALLAASECSHPLAALDPRYGFAVPLLDGEHVTEEAGTGFVHTAPGHGREDYEIWIKNGSALAARGIDRRIPFMVDADGFYTDEAPGFLGARVIDEKGNKGDANQRVIEALIAARTLVARGRLKHQYPHSWRSKKPVIFRNTPQWFIAMDKPIPPAGATLRQIALRSIGETQWFPGSGENRIRGMIASRPDWVVSRQRAWGVPIAVFVNMETGVTLRDARVDGRIVDAFETEGADAWFAADAAQRFLAPDHDPAEFEKIDDVLDVWFDSGSTHAFTLEDPAHFPGLAGIRRKPDGGDEVMYLEGSDQHRGWFHSSLLESCGTRGRAPYDAVLTHGFVLDDQGRKMSKSLGNVVAPQTVIRDFGADILRLWVAASDYSDDLRIGKEILATFVETYRKLRNTLRWMLGALSHWDGGRAVDQPRMDELDRFMLHRLAELHDVVRGAYAVFDFKKAIAALTYFMTSDLSAFYFDIRKDALYCDPLSSETRLGALETIDRIFHCLTVWLAPILSFTSEEAWLERYPDAVSVHLERFLTPPAEWRDDALAARWALVRRVRSVVTGALELERAAKRIGSSLEAAPRVFIADDSLRAALEGVDLAEVCITSAIEIERGDGPADAFRLQDVAGVAVLPGRASGRKCARSWKISPLVGADPSFPDVTPRDAQALRELIAAGRWTPGGA